uniref:Uncharacterized protein n=1 Tax=Anguilla anguilla TaxID=7936 RepID=A0A0E9RJG6_ANGAN
MVLNNSNFHSVQKVKNRSLES